ncbi:murein biosynthesis integral membrane protein MurJ [Azorhizobium doebereinerae]|uniref:murein biosynthesis integral membrane protein MurJ n=1 Tax=Azorhizobium doebereinerae TaxID=281091 RepID=UPI00041EE64C|nr:lipid II flippase MurJ [Azorhizobium doebereinerae]
MRLPVPPASLTRASIVSAATLGSRLLGFARDAGTAAVLGAGPLADALMAALALPLLARRLLAEGAFNAALIPALARAEATGGPAGARRLATATSIVLSALLLGFAILGGLFMPALIRILAPGFEAGGPRADLAIACGRIALVYLPLAGAAAVYGGLANAGGRVALPAFAPILANIVVLAAIVVIASQGLIATATAAEAVALATVAAGVAQLALMVRAARALPAAPRDLKGDWRGARAVMRASTPALLFAGLAQLRLIIVAAVVSADPGSVSALNYAQRLVDLPLGLVGASAGAVLVPLLAAGGRGAGREASGALVAALGLALPAALGLALLADPIVAVLYQRGGFTVEDGRATARLLAVLALALPAQGLERVLAATALTHGLTAPVERVGLASLAACLVLAAGLNAAFGPAAGAAGIAICGTGSALAMLLLLARRGLIVLDAPLRRQALILFGASGFMALVVAGLDAVWPAPASQSLAGLLRLAGLVAAGMVSYGLVVLAFRRRRAV